MAGPMRFFLRAAVLTLGAALLLGASQAHADALDDAKAAGQVGERRDGYLGLVDEGAPAEVKAIVADVNARRRAHYEAIAKKTTSPVEVVAQRAGVNLIERAKPGHFIQDAKGGWVRK